MNLHKKAFKDVRSSTYKEKYQLQAMNVRCSFMLGAFNPDNVQGDDDDDDDDDIEAVDATIVALITEMNWILDTITRYLK